MTTITISTELIAKATRLLDKLDPDMVFTASFAGEVSGVVLLLKDALAAPATAPAPVAWINGHDLRLLGRQGRGALVWCDNEGNADTPLYLHPPATAPEPVAWMDDFGNAFPLGAVKGAGSWLDAHKRNWKPLYLYPPAKLAPTGSELPSKQADQQELPSQGQVSAPSWQDAPTCAGKWTNSVNWRVHKVLEETLSAYQDTNARWYGPIPEDKP